jgi:hypothetical protein
MKDLHFREREREREREIHCKKQMGGDGLCEPQVLVPSNVIVQNPICLARTTTFCQLSALPFLVYSFFFLKGNLVQSSTSTRFETNYKV